MEVTEALDREFIVEHAEALLDWLGSLPLSSRATSALHRELSGILSNDPGGYINGARPLAGVTVEEFIAELHKPNAGVVGLVQRVGDACIAELREKIPLNDGREIPDLADLQDEPKTVEAAPIAEEAPTVAVEPLKRRPGRPRKTEVTQTTAKEPDAPKRQRKPRAKPVETPAPQVATVPEPPPVDRELETIRKIWASLHPQAKRAVILYASELLVEV